MTTLKLRKSNGRPPLRRGFFLIALALGCFAFLAQARAVCQQGCDLSNSNTFLGDNALNSNTSGSDNTAIGWEALFSNTTGGSNTAIGSGARQFNTTSFANTAIGGVALQFNTTGFANSAIGDGALNQNTVGFFNAAIGNSALSSNTTGSSNIALGVSAGMNLTTGSNNIDIGNAGASGESNKIRIGTNGIHTNTFIAGISGVTVANGVGVIIDARGHLGTVVSSERFKDQIKPMDKASEVILGLQPVTFRYKHELDPDGIRQFGLVAEQVEKVNPDLVARDDRGKPYSVRYEAVNAMLLNEFLKAHRKVEQQAATIAQLKEEMETFSARLREQDSKIQKVSDQLELSRVTPQVAGNDQ